MRLRLSSVALTCVLTLAAGTVLAFEGPDDKGKKEQTPKSKQEQAAADKAAAEKAAADKAAAEKAATEKAAATETPGQAAQADPTKAAVNTIEDLFAAYGLTAWSAPRQQTVVVQETIDWKETTAKPAAQKTNPKK